MASASPTRVLFVCLGNICRSPAAEGVLKHLAAQAGRAGEWVVHSAGTAGYHLGDLPDPRMRAAARRRGIELVSRARQFTANDFADYDLILPMDAQNTRDVLAQASTPAERAKVRPFADWVAQPEVTHIPDPYYGGPEGFEEVLDLLERGCLRLLEATPRARS